MSATFKSGFVSIIGKPNAGKSTLLNALLKDKLAIVSPKVQTTRHRIKGILTEDHYQIVFSDTPGIISPEYKLHGKMMSQVKSALDDCDIVLFLIDQRELGEQEVELLNLQKIKKPIIVVLNKSDLSQKRVDEKFFGNKLVKKVLSISALNQSGIDELITAIVSLLPEQPAFFEGDEISDLPVKFFAAEMIREKLFLHLKEEIPYHSTVLVEEYKEKSSLVKIIASIIVSRDTQKSIIIGKQGEMIKKIGQEARMDIEKFIDEKVFLELHVKVRKDWRNNDTYLREYGY